MKNILTLLLCLTFALKVTAQQPSWTEYESRQEQYPESMYLVGFHSDTNQDNENLEEFLGKLSDAARVQVIQSIQVQIESQVTSDMKVVNGDVDHVLQQSSTSLAKAEIAGLQFKTYFHEKSNTGYALAFAKRSELIAYYKEKLKSKLSLIPQKITQAEQLIVGDDKQAALKSYYECMPIFSEIEEAQALLVALGTPAAQLQLTQTANYKTTVRTGISQLQNSDNLTLSQLAYFLSYGLHLQTGEIKNQVFIGEMTYQDTEMTSPFSKRFRQEFQQNLVKAGKYATKEDTYAEANVKRGFHPNYFTEGTYWVENGRLKVIVLMRNTKTGEAKATAEASIAVSWLEENNIAYIPSSIQKLENMSHLQLTSTSTKYNVKVSELAKKPLEVFASLNGSSAERVPVTYKLLTTRAVLTTEWSDVNGRTQAILSGLQPSTKVTVVVAELNVAAYLGLDANSNYAKKVTETQAIPRIKLFVTVQGPSAFIQTTEVDLYNNLMQVPFIEPSLKAALVESGYTFSSDPSGADLMVTINAKSRKGNNVQGVYFAYVNATVSITELEGGREIFKKVYTDVKGGSGNWNGASTKAYHSASKRIAEDVMKSILK